MEIKTPVRTTVVLSSLGAGVLTMLGIFGPEHSEEVTKVLSQTAQSQMAQAGFFFTLAAWLHAGRVKKEIRTNFESLTVAITQVAEAFRSDLKAHGQRLDNLANRVESLEERTKPIEEVTNA